MTHSDEALLKQPLAMEEYEEWQQARIQYAGTAVNESRREALNNFRTIDLQLWSQAPEAVDYAHDLASRLWGKSLKIRHKHLLMVLMNLFDHWQKDPTMYLGYSRRNSHYPKVPAKYNPARITKLTVDVMDALEKAGLIEHHLGRYSVKYRMGYLSKCRACPGLVEDMRRAGIEPSMVTLHPQTELLRLRKANSHKHVGEGRTRKVKGKFIDYQDTPQTKAMRALLSSYNAFLNAHDIRVPGLPVPDSKPVYRVFNNESWDDGGRFVGGWWMACEENTRRDIKIDGHPCIELDFRCCLPTLMYATRGLECPGDVYHLEGFDRKLVKRAFFRVMNNQGKGRAIKGMKGDLEKSFPGLVGVVDCHTLMDRLMKAHPQISESFFKKSGNHLMSLEADITEKVLEAMTSMGVCCLSIHDSYIVPKAHEQDLRRAMIEGFREVMNVSFTPAIK